MPCKGVVLFKGRAMNLRKLDRIIIYTAILDLILGISFFVVAAKEHTFEQLSQHHAEPSAVEFVR